MAEPGEFQAGVDAFRLGKLAEARAHLTKAIAGDPKLPGAHRFLGAVARAEAKWDECIAETRTAIQLNPTSSEIGDTRKLHDECRTGAGRAPYKTELGDSAAIAVTTNVPGAAVKIGGLAYGGTPLAPRPITAGSLEVDIEKLGWKPAHRTVDALAGIVTDVIVELEPDTTTQVKVDVGVAPKPTTGFLVVPPDATATLDGKSVAAGKLEQQPGTYTIELRRPDRDPWRRRVRIVAGQTATVTPTFVATDARESIERRGMILVGGGLVLAAAGFGALVLDHRDRYFDGVGDPPSPSTTYKRVSQVTLGLSVATMIAGAIELWRGSRDRSDIPADYALIPVTGGALVGKAVTW